MSQPWHQKDPSSLPALTRELAQRFPDLTAVTEGGIVYLRGTFPLIHDNVEVDRFAIEVTIPNSFPRDIPRVRETAGRVPHQANWHAFKNGELCIIVPEEWLVRTESTSVCAFLEGPVRNYFLNHALAEEGVARPMGERSHGSAGLFEAYGDLVGSTDRPSIERYLEYLTKKKIKSHWPCACGNGRPLRECHMKHVNTLKKHIPRWIAEKALSALRSQLLREQRLANAMG